MWTPAIVLLFPLADPCFVGQRSSLERVPDQVGLIAQPKLSHEICAVALNGTDADRQSLGNLRVGVALGRQVEHISLPARQGLVALPRAGRGPPVSHHRIHTS